MTIHPAWWVLIATVVVVGVAAFWYKRQTEQLLEAMRKDTAERLQQVAEESEARVTRIERDAAREQERAEHRFARDLLPVLDALDQAVSCGDADPQDVKKGIEMVRGEFERVLESHGIDRVAPDVGDAFDPNVHEAVDVREEEGADAGVILTCHRAGYRQGDDVLRAAMVVVSR